MERIPETNHGHPAAALARRPARALAAVAAAAGLVAVPSVAGASVRPASRFVPAIPSCGGVSAGAVSSAVGFSVPAPKSTTIADHVFVTKLGIYEKGTICTYGAITSMASFQHLVIISYDTLSKAPAASVAIPYIKAQLAKSASKFPGGKFSYTLTNNNGVEWLYMSIKESVPISMNLEFAAAWKGAEVATAEVTGLAKSKLTALAKLAAKNAGI